MSYMEDKEWDLLDKRINEKVTPVAKPLQRAVIRLDEDTEDMFIEMFNGNRNQIIIGRVSRYSEKNCHKIRYYRITEQLRGKGHT